MSTLAPATLLFDHPSLTAISHYLTCEVPSDKEHRQVDNSSSISTEVCAFIAQVIGTNIDSDTPLMQAGLSSLGALKLG